MCISVCTSLHATTVEDQVKCGMLTLLLLNTGLRQVQEGCVRLATIMTSTATAGEFTGWPMTLGHVLNWKTKNLPLLLHHSLYFLKPMYSRTLQSFLFLCKIELGPTLKKLDFFSYTRKKFSCFLASEPLYALKKYCGSLIAFAYIICIYWYNYSVLKSKTKMIMFLLNNKFVLK